MTDRGKAFAKVIRDVCWVKGWGTTGTARRFPGIDKEEAKALYWLVENGFLFHYEQDRYDKHRNWRYKHPTADVYGVTKKGWSVAEMYVRAAEKEIPGYRINYQYDYYPHRP